MWFSESLKRTNFTTNFEISAWKIFCQCGRKLCVSVSYWVCEQKHACVLGAAKQAAISWQYFTAKAILFNCCNWGFLKCTPSLLKGRVDLKSSHLSHVESSSKDRLIKDPVKFNRGKPQHIFAFQIFLVMLLAFLLIFSSSSVVGFVFWTQRDRPWAWDAFPFGRH